MNDERKRSVTNDRAHPLLDLSSQHYVGDLSLCLDDNQKVIVGLVAGLRILNPVAARVRGEQNQRSNRSPLTWLRLGSSAAALATLRLYADSLHFLICRPGSFR